MGLKRLSRALAGFSALAFVGLPVGAIARERASPPQQQASSPAPVSDIVAAAERYIGSGKMTPFPGAWCADFVTLILKATGHRALPNRQALSGLAYGPRVNHPAPGDIVVMARHIGIVVADLGDEIEIISGNWNHRVARSRIPRRAVVAFVRV